MKPSLLLTISGIYGGLLGLGYLIVPTSMMLGFGGEIPDYLVPGLRVMSSTFIGIAVVNLAARNVDASQARNAIFLGNTVGFGIAAIMGLMATLSNANVLGWVFFAINATIAILFVLVGRANMSTSPS